MTHCQCRYWFTWHIATGEAGSNLAGWTEPWGAMVWSKRSRQGGELEGSKWLDILVDSAFRGLQGTSCGEAHAGPRYCWNISHYMANKLLYSDNSSLDFFCENVIGISWEIATFWGCCSGGSITREEMARWPGGRAPSTVFFPNTSAWHCFSMRNPEYRRIERINKDMQLILYSPGIWVTHTEGRYIADNRMQQTNNNL